MPLPVSMDATWLDGSVQFNGQELRRADAALFNGDTSPFSVRGGIVRHTDTSLAVTVNTSDVITVQPGAVVVPGNAGAGNGCYRAALAAADTGQLDPRNATNPRMDLVIFRVLDTSVVGSHTAYTGRIEVLPGAPNATPANGMQTLPSLAVELARVTVPATGGGAATVDSSFRQYASSLGSPLAVGSQARLPASAAKWQPAVALDTGREYVWDGVAWNLANRWAEENLTAGSGGFTLTAGIVSAGEGMTIHKRGGLVNMAFYVNNGSAGAISVIASVPAGWRPIRTTRGVGNITSAAIARVTMQPDGQFLVEGGLAASTLLYGSITWAIP